MSNRLKSEVDVRSIDGEATYTLCFGTNACIEVEDTLHLDDVTAFLGEMSRRPRKEFRTLVRILLKTHHPEIDTDEKAGDVIDRLPSGELGLAVVCAFRGVTPEQLTALVAKAKSAKETKEEPRPEAAAAAGLPIS